MLFSAALSRDGGRSPVGGARAAAGRSERRLGPAVRGAEHDGRGSARGHRASSRCCATSPTCAAPPSRSRRTTRSCASPKAAARAERDRLNLIIDSVADPIIVTDPSGATVLMNAPAEELFTVAAETPSTAPQRDRAGQRRALLVVHLGPAARRDRPGRDPARRDRPDEPDSRRADSGRSDRRQGADRDRRADGRRHHPPRPARGARARAALRAAEGRRPTSCRCASRRRPRSWRRRTSCCGARRSSWSRRRG